MTEGSSEPACHGRPAPVAAPQRCLSRVMRNVELPARETLWSCGVSCTRVDSVLRSESF
jgi:hypothetical protein